MKNSIYLEILNVKSSIFSQKIPWRPYSPYHVNNTAILTFLGRNLVLENHATIQRDL